MLACAASVTRSANATAKGGPHGWDALTHLCFSKYLRLDRARSDGFVRAAKALLDAGASANTGFYEKNHQPEPEFESAIYGAAGVAHHAELTRLLLEHGADPNDGETPYHTPESYDNGALKVLVESGKLTQDSLATMLLRKHDWHDLRGRPVWLLDHGADPNYVTRWHRTALQQAILRDNAIEIIEALLDHGADGKDRPSPWLRAEDEVTCWSCWSGAACQWLSTAWSDCSLHAPGTTPRVSVQ